MKFYEQFFVFMDAASKGSGTPCAVDVPGGMSDAISPSKASFFLVMRGSFAIRGNAKAKQAELKRKRKQDTPDEGK